MLSFTEAIHDGWGQVFRVDRLVHYEKTEHQELVVFDNASFGRVLALDGIVQLTERDHHVYHEMIAHVPILAHGAVREVLVIGGGDGGVLREALRHEDVRVTLVEIDARVIETARTHLPFVSAGAFDHPLAEIVVGDGLAYVRDTDRRYDVIVVDSTDPVGPAAALFGEGFYRDCARCLVPGGVLVTQAGVPFFQGDQVAAAQALLGSLFEHATLYLASVPTYTGGPIALGFASNADLVPGDVRTIASRARATGLATRYWAPDVHVGAFALPPEVRRLVGAGRAWAETDDQQ
ncbi:polyamine aminopropyltransferase [Salinarimonas ramus]|uniref:Polyamine aminopropyltransferase n=1 Tax=Salinarimonas ramus TaxID=690164 RepID=A0A917V4K7_9HYPH|nr:polyamine aminopropyltransferase [Salinarimonas ramus]GGK36802.1 polyamine aminopropyltransferase [Salinarimonas ramus]